MKGNTKTGESSRLPRRVNDQIYYFDFFWKQKQGSFVEPFCAKLPAKDITQAFELLKFYGLDSSSILEVVKFSRKEPLNKSQVRAQYEIVERIKY